jgi:DNA-binding LacI/PurR family transcriptional regulator
MRLVDLARRLNVSHTTVSRALNPRRQHMISEALRRKIVELADKSDYRPERMASGASRTHTFGVVLPVFLSSVFFHDLIVKVMAGVYDVLRTARRYSCKVVFLPVEEGRAELDPRTLKDDMEGLLISSHCGPFVSRSNYLPPRLASYWRKPAVVLNLEFGLGADANYVTFDNLEAAYSAVTYLIKKGHRYIAFLQSRMDFEEMRRRREGYVRAHRDRIVPVHPSLLRPSLAPTEKGGFGATLSLFKQRPPWPTAIFTVNDEMAIGALRALEKLGKRCPQDVAVMGFDGLLVGEYVRPRLSTVAQPLREMAAEGTKLLIDLIEGRVKSPQSRVLSSELIIRESA